MTERFTSKVMKTDTCWLWTAATLNGYGVFWNPPKNVKAHRYAYELWVGPIPQGLTLDHLCRVRNCVNPDHLEPVTMGENNRRSTPYRTNRTECIYGHPYSRYGRMQNGYPVCRICDNLRHREARKVASCL